MNKFIQVLGGGALALPSVCAYAEISYLANAVFDTESGLYWRRFDKLEQGQALGFSWASVTQTADLFLHYAPPDADGNLPGYNHEPGRARILSYTTSGDGMSYAFTWDADYYSLNYLPPVLSNPFGHNIYYGNQPFGNYTDALLAWLSGDIGQPVPVLFRDVTYHNQYGYASGAVEGIINPPSESTDVCPPCNYYDPETGFGYPVDYYKNDGSLKVAGYLMVGSSVPEPSHHVLFLAGIAGIALRRKLGNVCRRRPAYR